MGKIIKVAAKRASLAACTCARRRCRAPLELQKYFGNYASFDLTELPGLDNLHEPGIIAEAQALTAHGAKASF